MKLSLKGKLLIRLLFEKADPAGVWSPNWTLASQYIGVEILPSDMNEISSRVDRLENGKYYVLDFIEFQYGTLSENCKPHTRIIALLKKHGIYERVLVGYTKGTDTLEDKDKDKEEEEDKDFGKSENLLDPVPPLNPVKGTGLPFKLRELFLEKGPPGYQWGEVDSQASGGVIKKIRGMITDIEKADGTHIPGTANDQKVFDFFSVLLDKLPDFYREKLFSVPAIDKHFNQIVNEIKSAKSGNRKKFGSANVSAEWLAETERMVKGG